MKRIFGKRTVAVLTAFVTVLSLISLPAATALAAEAVTFITDGIQYSVLTVSETEGTASVIANDYSGAITIPETVDNGGITYTVTSIGAQAFENCSGLTSVNIPGSVASIGDSAFGSSGLISVVISEGVTSIGDYAFCGCSALTSVNIPASMDSIGMGAFGNCYSLESVSILEGVTSIGSSAFSGCSRLTSIIIPDGVDSIEEAAFYVCSSLTSISIPDGVTSIGAQAFEGSSSLSGISIPGSVTSIGDYALRNCSGLSSIAFLGNTPPSFGSEVFADVPAGLQVMVPYGAASVYTAALDGKLPADAQIVEAEPDVVDMAAILGVTPPVKGGTPVTAITDTEQYTGTISWAPADDTFAASTAYTATITLTPKEGYTLTGVAENYFTVAGADPVNNAADSGVITAVFPATEADTPDCSLSVLAVTEFSGEDEEAPLTLTPVFSPDVYDYSLEIHCSTIVVSAYAKDPAARANVKDPDYVFLGNKLFAIEPNVTRVITIEVTNGTASQIYEIEVSWHPSSDTSLKSLSVSYEKTELPLTPVFDPATHNYSLTVHSWVDSVDIVAEAKNEYAYIWGDGISDLDYGENIYEVEVVAEDYDDYDNSDHYSVYTITITRLTPEEDGSVFSTSDGLIYEDRGTYIAVKDYEGDGEDVTIPTEVTNPNTAETKPVTVIADGAFWMNETVKSVAFPSGITKIGDYSFSNCKSLQSVTLPSGLKSLGWNTFVECTSLESATFPEGLISIGDYAFAGCKNLGNVTLPGSLEELGWCAFTCCESFTSFTLPGKIEETGEPFLPGCTGLATISAGTNTRFKVVDGVLLSADGKDLIKRPSAMSGTNYDIPVGVWSIYEGAFDSCGLESVSIPEGVTELTGYVFVNCQNLNSVTFPDYLASIGGGAFDQCTNLTSIMLPVGLEDISGEAFSGCTSLTSIGVDSGNDYYMSYGGILYNSGMSTLVMFPPGIEGSFTVPDDVSYIGEYAFSSSRLTGINFGPDVTDIGYGAFQYCDGLTSVVIPGNVDEIEDEAFFDCSNLSRVTIGSGLSYLGWYSFEDCPKLAAIYFLGNAPELYDDDGDYEDESNSVHSSKVKSYPGDRSSMKTSSYDENEIFPGCSPYLTIYYASGRTGFRNPWNGHPAVKFYPSYKYSVRYNLKGAPGTIPYATVYKYGKAVQPLNPEWEGHKFLGWFKDSACTIPWSFGKYTVTSNITLYAGWTQPENAYLDSLDGFMICDEEYDGDLVLNREFHPSIYSYTAKIGEYDDSFSVSPVASYKDAIIMIDGVPAAFKIYSVENGKSVTSRITVSNGTGQTRTYTLTVTRAKSTNNYLSDIAYSDGTLVSELDTFTQTQKVRLYENTGSVTITPMPEDSHSKVYIGGVAATSRKYYLDNGHSASVTITVVSQSGKSNYYKVYLTRDKSTNANLKNIKTNYTSIKVTPALSADNTVYTVYLPSSISSVTLYAVKENKDAYTTFKYGAYSWKYSHKTFSVGYGAQKVITIRVTPQDRTVPSKDYTVKIIRAPRMYSFSASPKPGTYAELTPGGSNLMTFKWTQYGPGDATINVYDGTDWHQVFTGNNTTHTATWDGSIEGSYLAVGTYKARISVTNLGAKSSYKYLYFKIKPAPTVTLTASPATIVQGGTQRTKITVRWNIVTNIKVEIYDSAGELVATLYDKTNRYANTLYWYWYGKHDTNHGGTVVDPGDYTVKVTAGSVEKTATVTVNSID